MKCVFALVSLFLVINSFGQSFTPGNLVFFVVNNVNSNNSGFEIVEINNTTANQTTVVVHPVDSTGANALRTSGINPAIGYLSNSNDNTLLCFAGCNSANTLGSMDTVRKFGVGAMAQNGIYTMPTTYHGGQTIGASTLNNTAWYVGDIGGLYTNNATSPISWPINYRLYSIKAYGGRVYALQTSSDGTPGLRGVKLTGSVFDDSGLNGLANLLFTGGSGYNDFAMVSSHNDGIYDVIYVIQGVGLIKLVKSGTTWTGPPEQLLASAVRTMTARARADGTGIDLYFSSGNGVTGGNSIYKYTDLAGGNVQFNLTNRITLYTVPSPGIIKGLAFAPQEVTILPINLASFNASLINGAVDLLWSTATEVNAARFEVERSSDATAFASISTVAANNVASSYSYIDQQPLSGVSYYRLKLVDKDGSYKYSNVISINSAATTATHLSVYPNPVTGTFTLIHDKAVTDAAIKVITIDGKTIFTQSIATGATQSTVDVSKLISGTYLVVFDNKGNRSVTQFIK